MTTLKKDSKPIVIRRVWAYNVEAEFALIHRFVDRYRFVSMDTEFPGVIYSSKVDRRHIQPSELYSNVKANVDALKLIQLGLTFSDENGNLPDFGTSNCFIWEFNFRDFDVNRDPHNKDSIDLLRRQGIDFNCNVIHGVNSLHFSELMARSGLVCNERVTWVTFHGTYDFAYLVKILTRSNLPDSLEGFSCVLRFLFGRSLYDMKHMIRYCNGLYGGLECVASTLKVGRIAGKSHQAASDSLLTWQAFQKMIPIYFGNNEATNHAGMIFGLEVTSQ
ncbi:probable CCR4-associated factor 1 homolog 9 [Trifolium pratense]|uniref:probable CCR4-associated factor 1 homolog 9 n=2 Tax=Trifolium pratense TaxID=57577 RepID=UPI001E69624E|nr:probable CCR4-associated factor 1 homolog 9 [Trifolium pratense]